MINQISPFLILLLFSCANDACDFKFDGINPDVQEVYETFDQVDSLQGNITHLDWQSTCLNETRMVSIYQPPNYDSGNTYGVLFVTDDIGAYIPYFVESLILEKKIEPLFIVGIYNRHEQPVDSVFGHFNYDFRNMEFMKEEVLYRSLKDEKMKAGMQFQTPSVSEAVDSISEPVLYGIVEHRYERFCAFINNEVVPYMKNHYSMAEEKEQWSIGGLSSGGAFMYNYSCDHPHIFGNTIVMSPAGPFDDYDFSHAATNYFIAAGNQEPFIKESLNYLDIFDSLKIPYIHYTYNAGHDANMWLTFYLESLKKIYCRK
ncbi:MAG: hypothetical protein HYZ14_19245 [Bacteroidetes bacterium]|nr:hypothetical protein [Bacteroidota bacterium]